MRRTSRAFLISCSVALPFTWADASLAQGCLQIDKNAAVAINNQGLPNQTATIINGTLDCPGGKRISAGEIAAITATGTYTLNRNVVYRDGEKNVTADFGQYFSKTAVFQARGNVVVTDIKTGSRLTAPSLDYYQTSSTNKVARMVTMGGRAHAVMKDDKEQGGAPVGRNRRDSTTVDADIIEVIGERSFHGTGNAIIVRPDMRGYGSYVEYNQDGGDLLLAQNARVDAEKYRLQSDTIRAIAEGGKQVREVRASRNAILTSDEVRVESPFLRIYLDSGLVSRMVATRPTSRQGQPVSLPRVLSKAFNVSADSIDAVAPKQILERVDAVGHAFGERIDTVPPPEAAKEMPDVLSHDWLRGDTLHATFTKNPDAKPDSAGQNDRVLQRIIALGQSASTAIRMQDPEDKEWKIHYTLADVITVDFVKGAVMNVDLKGNVRGVYLTPINSRTPGVIAPGRGRQ